MIARVAATHGRPFPAVAREPYALTLYTFAQLQEHERIMGLVDRFRALETAGLLAFAFHEPKRLGDVYHELRREAGALPSDAESRALADEIIAAVKAHDAQRAVPAGVS